MPIPHTDRIKEAPAVALRAVFAGIGQLLMAVDKIRGQGQEQSTSPAPAGQKGPGATQPAQQPANGNGNIALLHERSAPAASPAAAKAAAPKATAPKPAPAKAATAKAATVKAAAPKAATARTATAKTAAHKPAAVKPKAATAKPAAQKAAAAKAAAAPKPAAAGDRPAEAAPAAAGQSAPIPGYDDLSIASLRARLRGLDATGVQSLLAYEKAHAQRGDVITMFERRLVKIEDEAG